uniref:Ig-like domain-containing protein n=1 Tax=Oryctolagus cuniculus TaxID=9986 RepID=G1SD56_RABIT
MGGGAQTPALTALLCLGEPGTRGQWDPSQPSIWADPGPLVAVGSAVTLWCQGSLQAEVYHVYKEGNPLHKADFPITMSMSSQDTGQYWCVYWTRSWGTWGGTPPDMPLPSPAGMFPAPSLSAQPSLVVASGGNVSLSCRSEYDDARTVHLLKEGGAGPLHSLEAWFSHVAGVWQATFLLGPVGSSHGGIYRCYRAHSSQPHVWSLPSEPLEFQVTETSLQAQPGTKNVTFYCQLEMVTNTFFLLREGGPSHPQGSHGVVPAEFPGGPVTSAHTGTYRCFGAYSDHVWSFPSEPVKLLVTGEEAPSSQVLPGGPSAPAPVAWDHTAQNLLRIGLAVLVLVALTWLLAEDWLCRWRTQEGAGHAQAGMDCDVCAVPQSGVTCTEWGVGAGVEVTAC